MDNLQATGMANSDDVFNFVPPNLLFSLNMNDRFSCKEEKERYLYHKEHEEDRF